MSFLLTPTSPATSYILTFLILALSLVILILTVLLTVWATNPLLTYPTILVRSPPSSQTYSILAFPSDYASVGLVLNIIPGAGGTIDALLLSICLSSIDHIYLAGRHRLAKVSKLAAKQGVAPTWLWAVTIFIVAFSVGRSLVGFIGAMVGYYTSARFVLPGRTGSDGAYVADDGRGFSVGGWTCQVKDYVVSGDAYRHKLGSLCSQEQAARWLTLPLLVCYSLLLWVVVARFMAEKRRMKLVGRAEKRAGDFSESE